MIDIKNLTHYYKKKSDPAIKDINLKINDGEIVVLIGSSGSGKTTLLRCINRLVKPTVGEIYINGRNILNCNMKEVEKIRQKIGMIFQHFNLIERETVLDNVLDGRLSYNNTMKSMLNLYSKKDVEISLNCLARVGMERYAYERVENLSGGEKQRVGIARALAQHPEIILADEPVSNLDPKLMREIMDLLQKICIEDKITLVISLHFLELAKKYATRFVGLRQGKIVFNDVPSELTEENIVNVYGKTRDWLLFGKLEY